MKRTMRQILFDVDRRKQEATEIHKVLLETVDKFQKTSKDLIKDIYEYLSGNLEFANKVYKAVET